MQPLHYAEQLHFSKNSREIFFSKMCKVFLNPGETFFSKMFSQLKMLLSTLTDQLN